MPLIAISAPTTSAVESELISVDSARPGSLRDMPGAVSSSVGDGETAAALKAHR